MNNIFTQIIYALKKPRFIMSFLFYFIALTGLKIFLNISIFLNIFTLFFIPLTLTVIYIVLKIMNSENFEDQLFDNDVRTKYFGVILSQDKNNIEKLFKTRDDIKKILKRSHINQSKQSLIEKINIINFNDLIQKYANNSVKLKFIDDFLSKKKSVSNTVNDKLKQLNEVNSKYRKLNEDIYNSFDAIQAQAVLILADDISNDVYSKDTIEDVTEKIKNLELSNDEINKFYISIHKGELV